MPSKCLLDHAIFKRVKRNHDKPSARQQAGGKGLVKSTLELFEFCIDRDSQRLENTSRRMFACVSQRTRWYGGLNRGNKLPRRLNWRSRTMTADFLRDLSAEGFLAVVVKDTFQISAICGCEQFGSWSSLRAIEAQIEWSVDFESEASLLIGKLIGGQPEVDQNSVRLREVGLREHFVEIRIAGLHGSSVAMIGQSRLCEFEHHRVAVAAHKTPIRANVLNDLHGMPARTDCAVNDRQTARKIEPLDRLAQKNRTMNRRTFRFGHAANAAGVRTTRTSTSTERKPRRT